MTYKLFIDDERFPPNDSPEWRIARSSEQAINLVKTLGVPTFISYDHDLGGEDTSMVFINWLIESYLDGELETFPARYTIHSQNPVGVKNIKGLITSFLKVI